MGPGGDVDDRVRSLFLDPGVVPGSTLSACVLGIRELGGAARQSLLDGSGVEGDLDHFPVALVQVVELVEPVVEPELERDPAHTGLPGDVRVGDRRAPLHELGRVPGVRAARPARVAGQVEVVVGPEPRQVGGGGRGGEQVGLPKAPAGVLPEKLHLGVPQRDVDRGEAVLLPLPRAGRVGVRLHHHDRDVAGRKSFGRSLGSGVSWAGQHGQDGQDDAQAPIDPPHDADQPRTQAGSGSMAGSPDREDDSHMAGLISRTSNVVKAWISKLLDRAEDPSVTLDYSYEKQLEMLQNVKRGVADVVTAKKRLELQTQKLEQELPKLDDQARKALAAGREDLARAALERKAFAQQQLQGLDQQISGLETQQEKLLANEKRLSAKVEAFRSQKEVIKAQYSAAEAQVRIGEAATGIGEEMADTGLAIQRAQDKTEQMQARAAAVDELVEIGRSRGLHHGRDIARPRARAALGGKPGR